MSVPLAARADRPVALAQVHRSLDRFPDGFPALGRCSVEELKAISQKSCGVLRKLGSEIQWQHSYVTDDKIYCVYIAPNEGIVREHAKQGGFPADSVAPVRRIIDPTTAE